MAISRITLVCMIGAAVCGLTMSQAPGADQSLFNLMSPNAGAGGMGTMGGAMGGGLDGLLNTMGGGSFANGAGGSPAPNPTFPTMMGGGMPQQQQNPMSKMFPYLMFSGIDMSKMMMMMLMGMGGMGGGMGGMGMWPMLGLMNNM